MINSIINKDQNKNEEKLKFEKSTINLLIFADMIDTAVLGSTYVLVKTNTYHEKVLYTLLFGCSLALFISNNVTLAKYKKQVKALKEDYNLGKRY